MITYFSANSGGNTLRGLLHKGNSNIPVIIVHGFFSSNKIGPYRLYYQLADYLNKGGFTVLRIDLSAMGESDGEIDCITFKNHVEDLYHVIKSLLYINHLDKIHIIAHCVGCCTTLCCLSKISPLVASLSLVAPFIPNDINFRKLLGENGYSLLMNKKPLNRKGMNYDKSFIDAGFILDDIDMINIAKEKPLNVFLPELDELSPIDDGIKWAQSHGIDYKVILNADHNILDPIARRTLFSMIKEGINEANYFYLR